MFYEDPKFEKVEIRLTDVIYTSACNGDDQGEVDGMSGSIC